MKKYTLILGYIKNFNYTNRKAKVYIDIELEFKDYKQYHWKTLEIVKNPLVLSICGDIFYYNKLYNSGQIDDILYEYNKNNQLQLNISKQDYNKLLHIWNNYHLNNLKPYSYEQYLILKENNFLNKDYKKTVNFLNSINKLIDSNGYEYGSDWLYMPLSKNIVEYITKYLPSTYKEYIRIY